MERVRYRLPPQPRSLLKRDAMWIASASIVATDCILRMRLSPFFVVDQPQAGWGPKDEPERDSNGGSHPSQIR